MRDPELMFANDARGAVNSTVKNRNWMLILLIGALFVAGGFWANWAKVEQVTSALGRVIPSQQTQIVESLEPGIVAEILVKEGARVDKGQGLIRIDDTSASSRLGELRRREAALDAELHRLNAHISGFKKYEFPADMKPENKSFYEDQASVFITQQRRLDEQASVRRQQLIQKKQGLAEAIATAKRNQNLLTLANKELKLIKRLYARKAVPELDYIRVQRESVRLSGELQIAKATQVRLKAEVREAEAMVLSEETNYLTEVSARISKINADLAVVKQTLRAASDTVRRTILRSPVAGVVNKINVSAINEVVTAGTSVVEIVPIDDQLLVEARIRPEDVAFISPGLDATIRITAYDYTQYGTLSGTVNRIGADTITDENRETFYQVVVKTDLSSRSKDQQQLEIIPGMVASVDIVTGDRSILQYILKPILVMRDRALRDPR